MIYSNVLCKCINTRCIQVKRRFPSLVIVDLSEMCLISMHMTVQMAIEQSNAYTQVSEGVKSTHFDSCRWIQVKNSTKEHHDETIKRLF